MKKESVFTAVIALPIIAFSAPVVSEVTASQPAGSPEVTVEYTLSGASAVVTLSAQTNCGNDVWVDIGDEHINYLSGDVAQPVEPGRRSIKWRPDRSWPNIVISDNAFRVGVKAWSLDAPPPYMVLDLVAHRVRYFASEKALPQGGLSNEIYRSEKLVLRRIPAAGVEWRMGSPETEIGSESFRANETPHLVTLTKDYYIGIYPVTRKQHYYMAGVVPEGQTPDGEDWVGKNAFKAVGYTYYNMLRAGNWPDSSEPGEGTVLAKMRADYGMDFDLPTEAQWEFACRAGTGSAMYNGKEQIYLPDPSECWDDNVLELAWYNTNSAGWVHEVGQKKPNGFGLYDMLGNVCEFCRDRWTEGDEYGTDATDPKGGPSSVSTFVLRGGSAALIYTTCRSAYRGYAWGMDTSATLGWRLSCPVTGH